MNRILTALALVLAAATPAVAVAQSSGQAEANRRLNFLRSVTVNQSWLCVMKPVGGGGPNVTVAMTVSLLPGLAALVSTTSTALVQGRTYSAVYRLTGDVGTHDDGRVSIQLDRSRMARADTLPNGLSWSDSSSVRLSLEVVRDTMSSGRYPYMLQGYQTDDMGRSSMVCGVTAGR